MNTDRSTAIQALRKTPLLREIGPQAFIGYRNCKPIMASKTPDTFHNYRCPHTNLEFEWCYHSSGVCFELRDQKNTFWVAFRFVAWDEFIDTGCADIVVDNLGGDFDFLLKYTSICMLKMVNIESYYTFIPLC